MKSIKLSEKEKRNASLKVLKRRVSLKVEERKTGNDDRRIGDIKNIKMCPCPLLLLRVIGEDGPACDWRRWRGKKE